MRNVREFFFKVSYNCASQSLIFHLYFLRFQLKENLVVKSGNSHQKGVVTSKVMISINDDHSIVSSRKHKWDDNKWDVNKNVDPKPRKPQRDKYKFIPSAIVHVRETQRSQHYPYPQYVRAENWFKSPRKGCKYKYFRCFLSAKRVVKYNF